MDFKMNQTDTLRDLLGSESGASWVAFMDYAHEALPNVLNHGKPGREAIKNSIIGDAGFSSWKDMIKAPVVDGGLGWNISAWNSWKRAYGLILKYPYLRDLELTSSLINTIHKETNPNFPADQTAWNDYQGAREQLQMERHQNSLKDAQKRSDDLTEQLAAITSNMGPLREQLEAAKKTLNEQAIEIGRLTHLGEITSKKLDNALIALKDYKKRSLWQRLLNK